MKTFNGWVFFHLIPWTLLITGYVYEQTGPQNLFLVWASVMCLVATYMVFDQPKLGKLHRYVPLSQASLYSMCGVLFWYGAWVVGLAVLWFAVVTTSLIINKLKEPA